MTDKYKHALFDYFLKDTPVKYESVTDEQWQLMHNSFSGSLIGIIQELQPIVKAISENLVSMLEVIAKYSNKKEGER